MKLSDSSIARPVTTVMIAVGLLVFGLLGVTRMPVDVYPNVTLPMVVIATFYPGAGPLEVESEISTPVEQRVGRDRSPRSRRDSQTHPVHDEPERLHGANVYHSHSKLDSRA